MKGAGVDSLILAVVKFVTTATGILCTMILSHALSLDLYGTFSQSNVIVNIGVSVTVLGLTNACNYFFNSSASEEEAQSRVNTIVAIELLIGCIAAVCILLFSNLIVSYFGNPLLAGLIVLVAFRPMLTNMVASLQVLIVSIGRAKLIAARNLIVSLFKLAVVAAVAYTTKNIAIILIAYLVVDLVNVVWFVAIFSRKQFVINPLKLDFGLVPEIFRYSIPMAIYVLFNALSREFDKLVIGGFEPTDIFAIYSNCSTQLPFDIISASFITVLVPILTRYLSHSDYTNAEELFRTYLRIGYLTTFVFGSACFVCSEELIGFLYGDKYIPGVLVFQLYLIVDMVSFANVSIVFSAASRTKVLMLVGGVAFIANVVMSFAFYFLLGWCGPALATVCSTVLLVSILLIGGTRVMNTTLNRVLPWKEWLPWMFVVVAITALGLMVRTACYSFDFGGLITLCISSAVVICVGFALGSKQIATSIRSLNQMR